MSKFAIKDGQTMEELAALATDNKLVIELLPRKQSLPVTQLRVGGMYIELDEPLQKNRSEFHSNQLLDAIITVYKDKYYYLNVAESTDNSAFTRK